LGEVALPVEEEGAGLPVLEPPRGIGEYPDGQFLPLLDQLFDGADSGHFLLSWVEEVVGEQALLLPQCLLGLVGDSGDAFLLLSCLRSVILRKTVLRQRLHSNLQSLYVFLHSA
jgi:hypothetical protein